MADNKKCLSCEMPVGDFHHGGCRIYNPTYTGEPWNRKVALSDTYNTAAPRPQRKGTVKITHRVAPTCDMCSSPPEYHVGYWDYEKPFEYWDQGGKHSPMATFMRKACAVHLVEVNYKVLVEAGLAPKLPTENLLRTPLTAEEMDNKYVGTTDEPNPQS